MKQFIILVTLLCSVASCKTIITPLTSIKTFGVEMGDPRFDKCKDIYQQWYSVTACGDTLPTYKVYYYDCFERECSCKLEKGQIKFINKTLKTWADKTMNHAN
jgi:hypothetical protein